MKNFNFRLAEKLEKRKLIIGLDEAGRGALAGPVVAVAVALLKKIKISKFQNPKKINPRKRVKIFQSLLGKPGLVWSKAKVSPSVIDRINIKNAAELAMERALSKLEKKLKRRADVIIVDGNHLNNLNLKSRKPKLVVKADEKIASCFVAGLFAKVWRDEIMKQLDQRYPFYGFSRNKGYPTKEHYERLRKYGKCVIHRNSFRC